MAAKNVKANLIDRGGWYHCIISFYAEPNKRKQKSIALGLKTKGNKRRAEEKCRELLAEWEKRLSLNKSEMPFVDFLKEWLEHHKNNIASTSYSEYKNIIYRIIVPYFEEHEKGLTLFDLQPQHIQVFYSYRMREHNTGARTIVKYNAVIHRALDYALRMKHIETNPADSVELPKVMDHRANFYSADELRTLIDKSTGTPLETVIRLAAWFGLRRGEILGLRWSSIDFDRKILSVTGTIKDKSDSGSKAYYSNLAKTKSSIRSFPMTDEMVIYLKNLKAQQDQNRAMMNYNHAWNDFVCVRSNGDLLRPGYVTQMFPQLCEECGLRKLKLHELRHTNISLLLSEGASMKELQMWAGHSNFNITANTYAHVQAGGKIKLTNSISAILGQDAC